MIWMYRLRLYPKFTITITILCAKFQGNWIWRLHFMASFVGLRKDEEKEERK